jgi:F0F1-type ATP synthase assembly protein I
MVAQQPPKGPRLSVGLMAVGSEMAGFTVIGVLIDYALGTLPGFTIGLTLFGCAVVFYHLTRLAKTLSNPPAKPPADGEAR